jgi:hypothetical protein
MCKATCEYEAGLFIEIKTVSFVTEIFENLPRISFLFYRVKYMFKIIDDKFITRLYPSALMDLV